MVNGWLPVIDTEVALADFEKGLPILVPGTTDLPSQMGLGATRDMDAVAASASGESFPQRSCCPISSTA